MITSYGLSYAHHENDYNSRLTHDRTAETACVGLLVPIRCRPDSVAL